MIRILVIFLTLIFISCNTQQSVKKKDTISQSSAGMDHTLQISAKIHSIEKTSKNFKVLAIIQNETGVTSFSKGDTVSLYPNFIRRENEQLSMKSSENEKMAAIQTLQPGSLIKANIKIRGKGKKRHGLIMDWDK